MPESLAEKKEFEVIIIPLEANRQVEPQEKFNPSDFFGIWNEKNLDADSVSKEMRDEWDEVSD